MIARLCVLVLLLGVSTAGCANPDLGVAAYNYSGRTIDATISIEFSDNGGRGFSSSGTYRLEDRISEKIFERVIVGGTGELVFNIHVDNGTMVEQSFVGWPDPLGGNVFLVYFEPDRVHVARAFAE